METTNASETAEKPSGSFSRRAFAETAATAAALLALQPTAALHANGRQDAVVVGVMGLHRGLDLAKTFAATPGVTVKYLCDTDSQRLQAAMATVSSGVDTKIQATGDFRDILNDPDVDALVCAAPNHWHVPASIMACKLGKHVYVEKPCSHNPWEGEILVKAARKYHRCVQMGNQRRSGDKIIEAIKMLHAGRIGRVHYSRCWYAGEAGSLGKGKPASIPSHLDYELWQGPAPRQPYLSNWKHHRWHYNWRYGNGEIGNNGVHAIDLSRWGLKVDYPVRVVSTGGRFFFDDDQQTPDTHVASFQFEDERQLLWEGLSCNRMGIDGADFGASFHGENGTLKLGSSSYAVFDKQGKPQETATGKQPDAPHIANFVEAIRADDPTRLNSEIEEGHKSTMLSHLGNIAYRTGGVLRCDPSNGHIVDNDEAMQLWKREYAEGWEPQI